jgi:hypothetical protein
MKDSIFNFFLKKTPKPKQYKTKQTGKQEKKRKKNKTNTTKKSYSIHTVGVE